MSMNVLVSSLLQQAKITAKISGKIADSTTLRAIFITPVAQHTAIKVLQHTRQADFISNRAEWVGLTVQLQPGVYQDKILPYRDDLRVQVISSTETDVKISEYVAVPLNSDDPRVMSNTTVNADFSAQDSVALQEFQFQLIDPGFAKLKNLEVSDNFPMSNVADVIRITMEENTQKVGLEGKEKYRGLYMVEPVDNVNKYRQILIPSGTRLINLPLFIQNHPEFGVYSRGLGCFYKQNYWWVYPLFNTSLVDVHHRPIDLIRMPRDKAPTLDETFYVSDVALTIISTGDGEHSDTADITKQNKGVGSRIVMGDAISGDVGYHYSKGQAITTRQETIQEYKLSDRKDGSEYTPLDLNPTGNVCRAMTNNSINEGEVITVEWHNGDIGYLEPGHPLRYQYISSEGGLTTRKGVLLGYRCDYVPITGGPLPKMKRTCVLTVFLKRQERYKAPQE